MEGRVLDAPPRGMSTGFRIWPPSEAEEVRLEQGEDAPGWSDGKGREAGT